MCVVTEAKETLHNSYKFKIACDEASMLKTTRTKAQSGNAFLNIETTIRETLCIEAAALQRSVSSMEECN